MTVQFDRPMLVTNSRCCSDQHVMCERCAAAALKVGDEFLAMNFRSGGSPVTNVDRGAPLEIPTINWAEGGRIDYPGRRSPMVANRHGNGGPLLIPSLTDILVNERNAELEKKAKSMGRVRHQVEGIDEDDEDQDEVDPVNNALQIPTINWAAEAAAQRGRGW